MAPKRQRKDAHKETQESLIPVDQALQAHRITLQGGGQGLLLGFRVPKVGSHPFIQFPFPLA